MIKNISVLVSRSCQVKTDQARSGTISTVRSGRARYVQVSTCTRIVTVRSGQACSTQVIAHAMITKISSSQVCSG
jgi:hypothetical protein